MNEIQATQADRLRQLHGEIMGAARMVLEKAIEAGGILQEVKTALPHGDFTAWIETNAGFNIRTAQRYMKIYEHREDLKNDSVSLLTDAHRMLTAPKEERLSDAEQDELDYLNRLLKRIEDQTARFDVLHERCVILKAEWGTLRNSVNIEEILDIRKRVLAEAQDAAELVIDADVNTGMIYNYFERFRPEGYREIVTALNNRTI